MTDEPPFVWPETPSEVEQIADDELVRRYRRLAFSGRYNFDRQIEIEITGRHMVAMKEHSAAAGRSARLLLRRTWVLVALTAAIVVLTVLLAVDAVS